MGSRRSLRLSPSQHRCLVGLVVACLVFLIAMLAVAYGPSAALFGAVFCAAAITLAYKRYRFGLRTFLVLVAVVGVWLGLKTKRDKRIEGALAGIKSSGGRLTVLERQPDFPWGLWRNRYRLDYYGLDGTLSEADFCCLGELDPASIQRLDLSNTGVTDESLRSLGRYTELEILSLANDTYTSGEAIPDRPQNNITDAALRELSELRELKGLDLRGTHVSDDGIALLSSMPKLSWIQLDGTQVSGSGLSALRSLPKLSIVELNGCKLQPEDFKHLAACRHLISLGLRNTPITDADLVRLEQRTQLGILRLTDTGLSNAAVNRFQASHPACKIER